MATLIANRLSEERGKLVKTAILTMELLLLSTGFISTFFMLKKVISPRYFFNMFFVNLSKFLKSFLSSPLYICLFINSVVILILTFSKFHHPTMEFLNIFLDEKENNIADHDHGDIHIQPQAHRHDIKEEDNMLRRTSSIIAMDTVMSFFSRYNLDHVVLERTTIEDEMIPCSDVKDIEIDCVTKLSTSSVSPLIEAREIVSPPSSNRVPETISTKTMYEEMVINQEDIEEDDDSLDATWKAITGGGNKKKRKEQVLKKSDTWPIEPVSTAQSIGSKDLLPSVAAAWKELRKSVTFNESLSVLRRGGLRGDISISAEESNKRFDDFIKKINHERLLQRQESYQRAFNNNNMFNQA